MGHGGYVAGLLVDHLGGAAGGPVEVTLRKPVPLDTDLELTDPGARDDGGIELRRGDELIAEARPAEDGSIIRGLSVPPPPTVDAARAAEAGSPSLYDNGRGVHPICFGCGNVCADDEGLQVFAGPVDVEGVRQGAGGGRPGALEGANDGGVLAGLDRPGPV